MKYEILTNLSKELRRRGQASYALVNLCPLIADYLGVDHSHVMATGLKPKE